MDWFSIAVILLVALGTIVAATVVMGGGFVVSRYNRLVQVEENVDRAWANVEVVLKQRSSELPKIIDVARSYLEHEQDVLREVTQARSAAQQAQGPRAEAEADQQVRGALANLFAVSEDYPELHSNEQFLQLRERVSSLEERIADRRELYNESTTIYNARIRQFPDLLFAKGMGLGERALFEAEAGALRDVDVGARLRAPAGSPSSGEPSHVEEASALPATRPDGATASPERAADDDAAASGSDT
jgi:LemA protein